MPHPPNNTLANLNRRHALTLLPAALLGACGTPLPLTAPVPSSPTSPGASAGMQRLLDSAQAHGLAAYRNFTDINISYGGQWRPLINRIQPDVVDAGFRGPSQERLMPKLGINAQAYTGPSGNKQVWWRQGAATSIDTNQAPALGEVAVWFNGKASNNPKQLTAAAVVAECYRLFLLGPLLFADQLMKQNLPTQLDGTARVDGRLCDVVQVWLRPGLGQVAQDRVALYIDRADSVTRRMLFTLEGFAGTRGAVAETDTFDHQMRHGVLWPMRSYERVAHPLNLPAHDWFITGLDVNRGYAADALRGPQFSGLAAAAAQPV
jgi:hypothetical protein